MSFAARWAGELLAAFALLTRLPVRLMWRGVATVPISRPVWAFPIVGAAVGFAGGGAFWLARLASIPTILAALIAVAVVILVTGAMHEDGLADAADGFGGGGDRARKLEIMRDSRIGAYGVIAILMSLACRIFALASFGDPLLVLLAFAAACALGRGFAVALLAALPPARKDGLGASAARPDAVRTGIALVLGAAAAFIPGSPVAGVIAIAAAGAACLATAAIAERQIGGQTGDVVGAGEQAVECAALVACAAWAAGAG